MTPLSASLIFVFISLLVSLFRHVFVSSAIGGNDDSNISITRVHTVAAGSNNETPRAYNSLYEAYTKPQLGRVQPPPLPYNSFALKKAVLNSEGVYLCDEKFAAVFEEATTCQGTGECKWSTSITVYRLPFLKPQEAKSLEVQGRVRGNGGSRELICTRKDSRWDTKYQINFVLILGNRESKKGAAWAMHSLAIEEEQGQWKEDKFSIKMVKWNLKNVSHYPELYSFDQKCLSYVTTQEPWLINYNCADSWRSFNILHPRVQAHLFSNSTLSQPFSPTHHVTPLFIKLYSSTLSSYTTVPECPTYPCPRKQHKQTRHLITLVFEIVNSPLRFGRSVAQLTIALADELHPTHGLVTYNLMLGETNPEPQLKADCRVNSKEHQIMRGVYTYQLGQGDDQYLTAVTYRHSLLCVFSINAMEKLRVAEVADLLGNFNTTGMPRELTLWTKQLLEHKKMESIIARRQAKIKKMQEPKDQEDDSWFDLDFFDFKYNHEDEIGEPTETAQTPASDKKDRKSKQKGKANKRSKKSKAKGRENIKFQDNAVGWRLQQMADHFADLGQQQPQQVPSKTIYIPMPTTVLPESTHFSLISGDIDYPLIYLRTPKKYLLTYQPVQQDDRNNQSKKVGYIYKYEAIGADQRPIDQLLWRRVNLTNQTVMRYQEEESKIDRFLFEIGQQGDMMNSIQSFSVVDARYEGLSPHEVRMRGMVKPYRKHVVVAWGWGLEVYEVNWDKSGLKAQLMQFEEEINAQEDGVEMVFLLPFIQLFATVYCLFQALITTR